MSPLSHRYSVYGVAVKSDWPLAFPPALDHTASVAEVEFVDGTDADFSDADALSDPAGPWFLSHVFPDQSTYVRWSGLYEFRIPADGSRVACRALDGCDPTLPDEHRHIGPRASAPLGVDHGDMGDRERRRCERLLARCGQRLEQGQHG